MAPLPSLFGDSLPKYKYTPMAPGARTFRLAKLLPPEPSLLPGLEPTVRISLIECSVGDGGGDDDDDTAASVEYDALSYAWDVPPNVKRPNRRIIVEDGDNGGGARSRLYIHRPLELALLRFAAANNAPAAARTAEGPRYELPFFIDQICIDQDDDGEKAQQVALMQAIYAHARRAVIWLGPGDAASDCWFAYVRDLCGEGVLAPVMALPAASLLRIYNSVVENPPPPSTTVLDDPVEARHRDELAALTGRFASRYPIAPCLAVLRRAWFTRLWTIQEACLAPAAVIACGDALLCFDCFRAGVFFYTLQNNYWLQRVVAALPLAELALRAAVFEAMEGFKRIFHERKAIHERRRRAALHELVIKHNIVKVDGALPIRVSLAQDRIYGLMGLTAPDDPVRHRLGVYYNRRDQAAAQARAYTEAMSLFLQRGHMDLLLFTRGPDKTSGLPSWVPDWTMDLALPVAWQELHNPAFAAGGGPPYAAQVRFPNEAEAVTRKVAIKGVFIGGVAATGQATYTLSHRQGGHVHINYDDAKLMFDEVDRLTREALPAHHAAAAPSPETLTHTRLRVYDAGLSARHFTARYPPAAGMERLLELQTSIAGLGERVLRSAAVARSFSLFNIYATVGITPWYVDYYSATTVLRRLARGPVPLARTVVLALADLLADVVGMCAASAHMWFATTWAKLLRRFARVDLRRSEDDLRRVGLDPAITRHADFLALLSNLERNVGRRAFRTCEGHVGMGPGETELGDVVVVLYGMTTPLVLRSVEGREEDDGEEQWTVVGEAYCDGVMNGEALGVNEREFVLV